MSNLIVNTADREKNRTSDSKKYAKNCGDFEKLDDGTLTGEHRYCQHSLICRQVDVLADGSVVPMTSDFLPIKDPSGTVVAHELFCTGMHDLRPLKERREDDKVS